MWPIRVLSLSARTALVSFTFLQPPGLPDEAYEEQYHARLVELRGLIRRFGGGELHGPDPAPSLVEPGVN